MANDMVGVPYQLYYINGRNYIADAIGKITNVTDAADRLALRMADCVDEDPVVAAASGGGVGAVLSVAGRTGNVTLALADISDAGTAAASDATDFDAAGAAAAVAAGLGSAAAASTTDFDAAGAASAAQAAAEAASDSVGSAAAAQTAAIAACDAAGAAAAAQTAAEAFATAADAPDIDVPITTHDATPNVVAATHTPAHNTLIHVEGSFLAREQAGADAKTRKVNAVFLTNNSGTVALVGSALGGDTHATAGATAWAVDLQTNGTVVQFVVTGAAATDINWRVIGEITAGP